MSKEPRFNGSFWVGHGQLATLMGNAHYANDKARLAQVINDHWVDFGDLMGAFKYNLEQAGYVVNDDGTVTAKPVAATPTTPATLTMKGIPTQWQTVAVNAVLVTVAGIAGRASASAGSGGVKCLISTDPTFPNDESKTKGGSGSTDYLDVAEGQSFYFKFTGGAETQEMRTSIS